jgi:hypothetical protein
MVLNAGSSFKTVWDIWMLRMKRFVMVKIKQNLVVNVFSVKVAGQKRRGYGGIKTDLNVKLI